MNRFKCPACGGNQYTSCSTAQGCIYCGHKELKKMEILEPKEGEGMRKIKFRAWRHDGEYSHMIESPIGVYTAIKHCLGVATPAGFSDIDNQPKKDGYTLMQWTGLKDRNGKEIYEGDIIVGTYKDMGTDTGLVVFKGCGFKVEIPNVGDDELVDWERYSDSIEVIGNIYDNPELLKED